MQQTKRKQNLILDLDFAFHTKHIVNVWKNTIRHGLRKQPLQDLHDFLDVHRNIHNFAQHLHQDILTGYYRPSLPEFVHSEKRDGIPRRLLVPEPKDALAFQCIVEVIEGELKKAQPSPNAYYSRSHHPPKSIEDVDDSFSYPWWILWPEFQKHIWEFTNSYDYVVVTDIANYFACIPLPALRNTVSSYGKFSENLLNFLFYLLEAFSWRPYYMPHSGVGLPQINFDAPRLLGHIYLFKVDEELNTVTHGDFVRWMDDINAGVNSIEEGKKLLRNLESILSSQGLKLNTSKSKILWSKDAIEYFWVQENRTLTIISNCLKNGVSNQLTQNQQKKLLKKTFKNFKSKKEIGQKDKVYKRYLNLFGMLKDPYLEKNIPLLLDHNPSLRDSCFLYFTRLGCTKKRLNIIEKFLLSGHCEDDISLFKAIECLVKWETPAKGKLVNQIVTLANQISHKHSEYSCSRIIASLWYWQNMARKMI